MRCESKYDRVLTSGFGDIWFKFLTPDSQAALLWAFVTFGQVWKAVRAFNASQSAEYLGRHFVYFEENFVMDSTF